MTDDRAVREIELDALVTPLGVKSHSALSFPLYLLRNDRPEWCEWGLKAGKNEKLDFSAIVDVEVGKAGSIRFIAVWRDGLHVKLHFRDKNESLNEIEIM